MLSMYVFSNGDTVTEVVNAVSAFMQTSSFAKAMSIAVMFSVVGCAIQYIKTHDLMNLLKWFSVYFCSVSNLPGEVVFSKEQPHKPVYNSFPSLILFFSRL